MMSEVSHAVVGPPQENWKKISKAKRGPKSQDYAAKPAKKYMKMTMMTVLTSGE
jgi:hypothetical protein